MRWVCFSYIYMPNTTKYQDNGYYVIYDCFNKAAKDCKTKDIWLGAFDLYIKKLFPQLEKRNFITVNIFKYRETRKRENLFRVSRFAFLRREI